MSVITTHQAKVFIYVWLVAREEYTNGKELDTTVAASSIAGSPPASEREKVAATGREEGHGRVFVHYSRQIKPRAEQFIDSIVGECEVGGGIK